MVKNQHTRYFLKSLLLFFIDLGQDQQLHLTVYIAGIQGEGSVVVAVSVGDM